MSEEVALLSQQLQRQMAERAEDAVLRVLTGQTCACGQPAGYVEFGAVHVESDGNTLRAIRAVSYFCRAHWPHDPDITVATIGWW